MMQVNNADSLYGYRSPTPDEVLGVSRIFTKYYASGIRLCRSMTIALCAAGLMLFSSYAQLGWSAVLLGVAAYGGAVYAIASKKRFESYQSLFITGRFQVLDGFVSEIAGNDKPGCCNVVFTSIYGQRLDAYCSVRQENLTLQTPLILVYVSNTLIRHGIVWAFTPFMLTAQSEKLRW